jgi:hypothetical protein
VNREQWIAANRDKLIEHEGRLWMPVEITIPGEGFAEAWRIGAREWRAAANGSLAGGEARIYPMKDSWTVYPAVSVPGAGDRLPAMPEEAAILRATREQVNRVQ